MFKYYYNRDPHQLFRKSRTDVISITTPTITRKPLSFREECHLAAKRIIERDQNIWVGLTGGWLSKIVVESFLRIGFKPNIFIMEFPSDLNNHDTDWAKKICHNNNIEPLIIETTVSKNISDSLIKFGSAIQNYSYYECLLASKIRTIPGRALIVDGLDIRRDVDPAGNWSYILDEGKSFWTKRYNALYPSKRIIDNFFTSSPEILLSFLELKEVAKITDNINNSKISLVSSRTNIFNNTGFLKPSPFNSTTGYVKIPDAQEINSELLQTTMGFYSRKLYFNLDELKNSLKYEQRTWDFV
jgi:hypothetical protein